ncbi:MAG: hypothetical protein ACOVP2_03905 [Armatimonadaceae bacterium]
MSPNNQDDAHSTAPSGNESDEVVFVPDAPSGLPVYFGGNVRAEVLHAEAQENDEGTNDAPGVYSPEDADTPQPFDASVTAVDPDRILSAAVSAPEDAIAALRISPSFGIYKERLDAARVAVRDGIRKASHPDVLHALNWEMQQLDKVAALPELGQVAAWLWARLVFGRGFAILAILAVLGGIAWSVWIVVSNR